MQTEKVNLKLHDVVMSKTMRNYDGDMIPTPSCANMHMDHSQYRIMIVDGHAIFRRGLASLTSDEQDLLLVAEADSRASARQLLDHTPIDLLVLEMDLPDGNGLDLIATNNQSVSSLILTGLQEDPNATAALEAGACGFVSKTESSAVILGAMRQVLTRKTFFPSSILTRLLRSDKESQQPARGIGQLSAREKEVFSLLGDGLTGKEIANKLGMSIHTVDTHRERMKKKLKLPNGTALTRHAVEWKLRYHLARQVDFNRSGTLPGA